jgi:hypothetical protein
VVQLLLIRCYGPQDVGFGRTFGMLESGEKLEVLKKLEDGQKGLVLVWIPATSHDFFHCILHKHTLA